MGLFDKIRLERHDLDPSTVSSLKEITEEKTYARLECKVKLYDYDIKNNCIRMFLYDAPSDLK
jgi:hypothetical protein